MTLKTNMVGFESEPYEDDNNSKPLEIDGVKKGFNPENLTLDGVPIKEGDEIIIGDDLFGSTATVMLHDGELCVNYPFRFAPLSDLRVNGLVDPYKNKELEQVEEELKTAENILFNTEFFHPIHYLCLNLQS